MWKVTSAVCPSCYILGVFLMCSITSVVLWWSVCLPLEALVVVPPTCPGQIYQWLKNWFSNGYPARQLMFNFKSVLSQVGPISTLWVQGCHISRIPDIEKSVRRIRKSDEPRIFPVRSGQKSSRGKFRKFCQALVASLWVTKQVKSTACVLMWQHVELSVQICVRDQSLEFEIRAWNSSKKWGFSWKWKSKSAEQNIFRGGKNQQAYFFSMKIKMRDLWMQIEGRKLIFMNFSVLDFFKFAPEYCKLHRF